MMSTVAGMETSGGLRLVRLKRSFLEGPPQLRWHGAPTCSIRVPLGPRAAQAHAPASFAVVSHAEPGKCHGERQEQLPALQQDPVHDLPGRTLMEAQMRPALQSTEPSRNRANRFEGAVITSVRELRASKSLVNRAPGGAGSVQAEIAATTAVPASMWAKPTDPPMPRQAKANGKLHTDS
eukprot:CAMPEP_0179022752 /NCGR_PEP_ID=MMETSP0796-20121207/6574_1 /TAXON_ID=73915 /ORGANISM="Pyrodinium bahamense, Strain pbaha01" /LENGTH=179 /DNA_ID=CAMNT_0020718637 /DNA_START=146 /DNA_END=683 /DNA_ORIENTATION=-